LSESRGTLTGSYGSSTPEIRSSSGAGQVGVAVVSHQSDAGELVHWLSSRSHRFSFNGLFSTAADALITIPNLRAHIIAVDLELPDERGLKCAAEIQRRSDPVWLIVTSALQNPFFIERAAVLGVAAWLSRPLSAEQWLASLEFVACRIRRDFRDFVPSKSPANPVRIARRMAKLLTEREQEILKDLSDGLLYKEIEDRHKLSHAAFRKCQHRIYVKLQAHTRIEVLNKWRELQLPSGGASDFEDFNA
jgi:DNA-binding NarL/FixJ family response regulator